MLGLPVNPPSILSLVQANTHQYMDFPGIWGEITKFNDNSPESVVSGPVSFPSTSQQTKVI